MSILPGFSESDNFAAVDILILEKEEKDFPTNSIDAVDGTAKPKLIIWEDSFTVGDVDTHDYSPKTDKIIEEDKDDISLKSFIINLESFMENGLIQVIEEVENISDSSSINTEIVNRIRNGNNVTIYTQPVGDTNDNYSVKESLPEGLDLPISEKEVVRELLENNHLRWSETF